MSNLLKRSLSSILLGPLVIFLIYKGGIYFNILLMICFLSGLFEIFKLKKNKSKIIIFLIFLIFIFSSYKLRNLSNGAEYFFLIMGITWFSDIGGFTFGKYIGGKKINIISPNKTYIGFFGSILFSQLSFVILNFLNMKISNNLIITSLVFIISSLLVITGDLIFSYFKRLENIKDYSNLIPGHGGLFDRIDGLIFLIIFYSIFLYFV